MNREVIKNNKEAFDYWLDGGEIVIVDPSNVVFDATTKISWSSTYYIYLPNDKYIELRIAQAQGKTIEIDMSIEDEPSWVEAKGT